MLLKNNKDLHFQIYKTVTINLKLENHNQNLNLNEFEL